ncbi:3617_t:CDS:1, partial [Racocetra persica]
TYDNTTNQTTYDHTTTQTMYDNTTQTMHDNTTQTMHDNTTTQITYDNTTLTQIIYDNTNSEISDIADSNNNIGSSDKIQNEYLDEDNKEVEDNEEYDLTYISKTEFGEYLQGWVEILNEEEETDIIDDQNDPVELDNSTYPALNKDVK